MLKNKVFLIYMLFMTGCSVVFAQSTPIILPGDCGTGEIPVKNADGTWGCTTQAGGGTAKADRINITHADSPYTLLALTNSAIVACNLTAGDITINLPAVSSVQEGFFAHIYIEVNPGNSNTLTVNTASGDTIRGDTSVVMRLTRDGLRLYPHTFEVNHWDALFRPIASEISVLQGTSNVTSVTTLQDKMNFYLSSSWISGGDVTDNGDGTVDVAEAEFFLRVGNDEGSDLVPVNVSAATGLILGDGEVNNVVAKYNSGSPVFVVQGQDVIVNGLSELPLYTVYRNGNVLDIVPFKRIAGNLAGKYAELEARRDWLRYVTGLTTTENAGNAKKFDVTAGSLSTGINTYDISSFDGDTDSFTLVYQDGAGGWTISTETELPWATDDGSGTLDYDPGTGRHCFMWVYASAGITTKYYVLVGKTSYPNAATARLQAAPINPIPPFLSDFGTSKLIARVMIQNEDILEISDYTKTEASGGTSTGEHNELGGLQGGGIDEYYHLSSAQHTIATQAASATVDGYVTTGAQEFAGRKTFTTPYFKATVSEGARMTGISTGSANIALLPFYESNATVRQGYVGFGSGANRDIYLVSDAGNVRVSGVYFNAFPVYSQTTAAAPNVVVDVNGTLLRSTSSIKYKTNVEDLWSSYANDFLSSARPIWYDSLSDNDPKEYHYLGFIAEELHEAGFPQLVHYKTNEDGTLEPEGVQYERITVILTKALQEAKAEIVERLGHLEMKVNALCANNAALPACQQ